MFITIGKTSKGRRIWLQGVRKNPMITHDRYTVEYRGNTLVIQFHADGKRKLCSAKDGIVDLVGKKISDWAGPSDIALVSYYPNTIYVSPTYLTEKV